jgi:hypothetical protein
MDVNAAGQLALQLMMGVSLAACAGLRAWLPLLCVGLLARFSHIPLNENFAFLTSTPLLTILGVATVIEILGDKIIAVDQFLDTIGTFARPIAGALVAASLINPQDPTWATVLGVVLGGGTALTVHTAKALTRLQSTAAAPVHGGTVNLGMSLGEDFLSLGGIGLAVWIPLIAFALAALFLVLCVYLIRIAIHHGKRVMKALGIG